MTVNRGFSIFALTILMVLISSVESQIKGFKLVLMWSIAYCHTGVDCPPDVPQRFYVHGFRPFDDTGEIDCNNNNAELQLELQRILDSLNQILNNGSSTSNNNDFFNSDWTNEWSERYSCLNLSPRDYSQTTAGYYNLFVQDYIKPKYKSLLHALESNDIPRNSIITLQQLLETISRAIHLAAEVKCSNGDPVELYEVAFCITTQGSFEDCPRPSPSSFYQSCNGKLILFPGTTSNPSAPPNPIPYPLQNPSPLSSSNPSAPPNPISYTPQNPSRTSSSKSPHKPKPRLPYGIRVLIGIFGGILAIIVEEILRRRVRTFCSRPPPIIEQLPEVELPTRMEDVVRMENVVRLEMIHISRL